MKAKKKFGQNFLIDNTVLDKISDAVFACEDDLIIEIGPGKGALTNKLLKKGCKVLVYEIDTDLIPVLKKIDDNNLYIKNIDFLETNLEDDLKNFKYNKLYIVGNLPYYITTPIIDHVIKSKIKHESLTIMVQLEVANRFSAHTKTKDYGYFTVYLQHFYDINKIINVKNTCFDPIPKVESAVISLKSKNNVLLDDEYIAFLKTCFKEKRKTLRNNLKEYNITDLEEILVSNNLSTMVRAEEIDKSVFLEIYGKIKK